MASDEWLAGWRGGLGEVEDEVGAAADGEFGEHVGNVKFDGALGNVEARGDFLVGKIFEQGVENLQLAAAEAGASRGGISGKLLESAARGNRTARIRQRQQAGA